MQSSNTTRAALALVAGVLGTCVAGAASHAATLAALQDGKTIVRIDTDKMKVAGWVKLGGGASLVGFDVRPADGKLYGLTPDGAIVTVDAKTGKWEKKSQLSEKLPTGATFSVDFNPVADRLRVLSSTGMSLRINVDDGKATVDGQLKYAEADANKGKQPRVTAAASSNSYTGTKETALYDLDAANAAYVRQAPPNDGILNTLGKLSVKLDGSVASGAAKSVGKVGGLKGKIGDIAILPAM